MKEKSIKIGITAFLGIALFTGAIFLRASLDEPLAAIAVAQPSVTIQENQLITNNSKLIVTEVSLADQPTLEDGPARYGQISFSFENINGKDQAFEENALNGYIAGLVGETGEEYPFTTDDADSLNHWYQKTRKVAQEAAEENNEPYYPGEFKIGFLIRLGAQETKIVKVVYQDAQGARTDIPVDLEPVITSSSPEAK
jgi:hypothetical protein